jgi:hypothetical protein
VRRLLRLPGVDGLPKEIKKKNRHDQDGEKYPGQMGNGIEVDIAEGEVT